MFDRSPNQKFRPIRVIVSISAFILFLYLAPEMLSEAASDIGYEITVPTRTPTPQPDTGNDNDNDNNDGGNNDNNDSSDDNNDSGNNNNDGGDSGSSNSGASTNPPAPTATPEPTATAVPVEIIPTPIDGQVVSSECGPPIFVAIFGDTNVRAKPDPTTSIVGGLVFTEGRPIIARSGNPAWWKITLTDGVVGWVSNDVGEVQGNINGLPVLDANDQPVTAPTWNPAPNPNCNGEPPLVLAPTAISEPAEPTADPTALNEPPPPSDSTTAESVAVVEPIATEESSPASEPVDDTAEPEVIVIQVPTLAQTEADSTQTENTAQVVPSLTPIPLSTEVASINVEDQSAISSESSALEVSEPSGLGSAGWIILTGFGLIIIGVVAMIFKRRTTD